MAEFSIDGRMKVKTLKKQFKEAFGATLRVYKGNKAADVEATLSSIRSGEAKGGALACRGNMKVGTFEDMMKETFGINKIKGSMKVGDVEMAFDKQFGATVQIKDLGAKVCVPNGITIGKASRGEY